MTPSGHSTATDIAVLTRPSHAPVAPRAASPAPRTSRAREVESLRSVVFRTRGAARVFAPSHPVPLVPRVLPPHWALFWGDTACAIVQAGTELAFPVILRGLADGLFSDGSEAILSNLWWICLGLVFMYAVRYGCRYFVSCWGHIMGARMESAMRRDLFDQYERFSFSYFDRHNTGDLMSRLVSDLFDIAEAAHHLPEAIIVCTIEVVGAFVVMFLINWQLALAMAVVTAVLGYWCLRVNRRMKRIFTENRERISDVNSQLEDSSAAPAW